MSKWISVKDRLPEIKYEEEGGVNCVLVFKENGFDCSSDIQIWNTIYLHTHECDFTHWMPLPESPEDEDE